MSEQAVLYSLESGLATITLNRPQVLNALTVEMMADVLTGLRRAVDEGARAVLLTGAGRGFAAGLDLAAIKDLYTAEGGVPDLTALLRDHFHPMFSYLRRVELPVICAVNGVAAGAGLSLALACDLRIAVETARFATAFIKIGLVPDSGIAYTLPRLIGAGRANYLLMSGEQIDASTALAWGMIDRVAPAEGFAEAAVAFARTYAEGPTRAYAITRRMLADAQHQTFDEVLAAECAMQGEASRTLDHRRAIMAFLNKETAIFEGR